VQRAWSELRVRRPSSGDAARTLEPILERIRDVTQQYPDDQVATVLNAEGLRTRMGLASTYLRVGQVRLRHGIPMARSIMPNSNDPWGMAWSPTGRWRHS